MKILYVLTAACFLFLSCSKEKYKHIRFQGKYIGKGCWDIIQIIAPVDKGGLPAGDWHKPGDTIFHNAIGAYVPDKWKDGAPFYFTVSSVKPEPFHTMECVGTPYWIVMDNISR